MTIAGGRYTISYNGEITNYVEIREDLLELGETFVSDSDTEVLLKAWSHWGTGALDRLEGMFGIAILDRERRTLTLARDPWGIKPLFYFARPDRIAFSSELRGLLPAMASRAGLDWQTAADYLLWGAYDGTTRTFIDGVSSLAPGHYLTIDVSSGRMDAPVRYWWPDVRTAFRGTYQDAVEAVRSRFLDSVKRNLRSDVPVGVALSGGVDSSAIVGAVRSLEPDMPIQTFSFVAPGFGQSEDEWIDRVVAETGAISHLVETGPGELERDLDDLIVCQGEPFGSTSIYAQYRVFKLAREQGVVVTLDGQGGDEMFAGYFGYGPQRMHSLLETGHLAQAARFGGSWSAWPGRDTEPLLYAKSLGQFAGPWLKSLRRRSRSPLLNRDAARDRGIRLTYPPGRLDAVRGARVKTVLRHAQHVDGLPALLRHGDRNSMRFSIESRVPFLDRELEELTLSLPEDFLVGSDGTSKRILRDAVRGLVPDSVIDRRDKIGFATPEHAWLARVSARDADPDHPIGLLDLDAGKDRSFTCGLTEQEIGWGDGAHWRLVNLRRWVELYDVDAT